MSIEHVHPQNDNAAGAGKIGNKIVRGHRTYTVASAAAAGQRTSAQFGAIALLGLTLPGDAHDYCAWLYPDGRIGSITRA